MTDRLDAALDEVAAALREEFGHPAEQPPTQPAPAAKVPGQVLDLTPWKLTLPTGDAEAPTEILQPQLAGYADRWFDVRPDGGVGFLAPCDAVTTSGSHYPRSELREMNGKARASWSNATGTHTLTIDQAITRTPVVKPEVVAGQIHDAEDDVIQIHLSGKRLTVKYADGKKTVVLDEAYQLGTRFTVQIIAANKQVMVLYKGAAKATLPLTGSGWYFKVGTYTQSNPDKGDGAGAAGEVVVYGIDLRHTA